MHQQLLRQAKMVEQVEKYQKERYKIMADNEKLHKEVDNIKSEYKQKEFDIEWKYKSKIKGLEKENSRLNKIIDKISIARNEFVKIYIKPFFISNILLVKINVRKKTDIDINIFAVIVKFLFNDILFFIY